MKRIEIEVCNPDCKYNRMFDLQMSYCYHPNFKLPKRIPASRLTKKHPFPDWCPLPDINNISK